MSTGKFIAKALEEIERGDHESALVFICAAVDATAQAEYQSKKGGKGDYTAFLTENLDIITHFGLDGATVDGAIRLPPVHPDFFKYKVVDADGFVTLSHVLYTVVRCGLLHETTFDKYFEFVPGVIVGAVNGRIQISPSLPLGLVFAVLGSPANAHERLTRPFTVTHRGVTWSADSWWGRRSDMRHIIRARHLTDLTLRDARARLPDEVPAPPWPTRREPGRGPTSR
jgi:hypothetical protein